MRLVHNPRSSHNSVVSIYTVDVRHHFFRQLLAEQATRAVCEPPAEPSAGDVCQRFDHGVGRRGHALVIVHVKLMPFRPLTYVRGERVN